MLLKKNIDFRLPKGILTCPLSYDEIKQIIFGVVNKSTLNSYGFTLKFLYFLTLYTSNFDHKIIESNLVQQIECLLFPNNIAPDSPEILILRREYA